ncbi:MAG: polysulfide reductase NrfD, partial [Actinobacteria bacterium]|nr:polysulfide reductase NrfD [Actinomycetota bacterium]
MSESGVGTGRTPGARPGREAVPGGPDPAGGGNGRRRRWRRGRRGEQPTVPPAEFTSYYGKPVLNAPVWKSPDIPGYLFLGGLAGCSSLLAAAAQLTGRDGLARAAKAGAAGAGCLGLSWIISDLGRPDRFLNMLRVFKPTSPMSVGSWLLAGYLPAAGAAAAAAVTGRAPRLGAAATTGSALLGPALATYTAVLISDTAVPAWHDGYRELPFVFAGSSATAAGGLGLAAAPPAQRAPARTLAILGAVTELAAFERMERRLGMVAEPYRHGRG